MFEVDLNNARFVRVTQIKFKNPNLCIIETMTRIPAGVPGYPRGHNRKHVCYLKDLSGKEFTDDDANVECGCQCDRFKFKWEYALHQYGAAQITHSNGAAAKITNPRNYPGTCKHIIRAIQAVMKTAQDRRRELERQRREKERIERYRQEQREKLERQREMQRRKEDEEDMGGK